MKWPSFDHFWLSEKFQTLIIELILHETYDHWSVVAVLTATPILFIPTFDVIFSNWLLSPLN